MSKMYFKSYFLFLLFTVAFSHDIPCNKLEAEYGSVCVCNATYCDTISAPKKLPNGQFHFYYTSDTNPGFNHKTGHFRMQSFPPYGYVYNVDPSKTYQTLHGFGGAFTDSFGFVFNSLSEQSQEKLMKSFFSEDGIEYSVCRVVLGSCDFSLRDYNYAPDYDPSLKSFNLTQDDYIYKIAQMKKALSLSKRPIKFMGSTWTSPAWMKNNNYSGVGYIQKDFHQTWADYHVKIFDAFKKEGIDFWAITTGNEPITLLMAKAFPVVVMFPEEQRDWVSKNLGPAIKRANYTTKIILLDDMRPYIEWWMDVAMRYPESAEYVDGIGLHWYTDRFISVDVLDRVHEKYPEKEIMYTESSINIAFNVVRNEKGQMVLMKPKFTRFPKQPQLGSWKRASYYASNILENLNHWVSVYMDWNLALDTEGGPNLTDYLCDASIIVNNDTDVFYKQPVYYVLGHFSKFMQPGSVVMDVHSARDDKTDEDDDNLTTHKPFPTPKPDTNVQHAGVINPDGSHAITFYNPKSHGVEIAIHHPKRGYASLFLEPNSINTIVYN